MAENLKIHKISYIEKEISIQPSVDLYEINGLNINTIKFLYRTPRSVFKLIPSGDYRLEKRDNKDYLHILNQDILQAEKIQIIKTYDFTASKYETQFNVDINLLTQRYNELVDMTKTLWLVNAQQGFIGDALGADLILPELDDKEMFIKIGDHYEGITLTDAELEIKKMIDSYVLDYKTELGNYNSIKLSELENKTQLGISSMSTQKDMALSTLSSTLQVHLNSMQAANANALNSISNAVNDANISIQNKENQIVSNATSTINLFTNNKKNEVINLITSHSNSEISEATSAIESFKEIKKGELEDFLDSEKNELENKLTTTINDYTSIKFTEIQTYISSTVPQTVSSLVYSDVKNIVINHLNDNVEKYRGLKGDKGDTGRGIISVTPTGVGSRVDINYTDSTSSSITIPTVKGDRGDRGEQGLKGDRGTGVTSIVALDTNRVQLNYGDGQSVVVNIPTVQGPQGQEGPQGIQGLGITSIVQEEGSPSRIKITYSNGNYTTFEIPTVKGDKGEKGERGADGYQGVDGVGIQEIIDDGDNLKITFTNSVEKLVPFPANEIPKVKSIFTGFEKGEFTFSTAEYVSGAGNSTVVKVKFKKPFDSIPTVVVNHSEPQNFFIYVYNITRESFDCHTNYYSDNRTYRYSAFTVGDLENLVSPTIGKDGRGIVGISEVGSTTTSKTYRITFTDNTTFDYTLSQGVEGPAGANGNSATLTIKRYTR